MKIQFYLSLLLLLVLPCITHAQNVKERIQNNVQIAEGKKNLERDIKELAAFQAKTATFKTAFENRKIEETRRLKLSILSDMKREVDQGKVKVAQARREVAQSSAEVRSDRREIRRNREDSYTTRRDRKDDKRDMARDQANKRDDQRDRRDDIRDQQDIRKRVEEQAKILKTLTDYTFSFEESALEKAIANKVLINRFTELMKADVAATKREIAEDKRERREDRRETRDDIQEAKEKDSKVRRRRNN